MPIFLHTVDGQKVSLDHVRHAEYHRHTDKDGKKHLRVWLDLGDGAERTEVSEKTFEREVFMANSVVVPAQPGWLVRFAWLRENTEELELDDHPVIAWRVNGERPIPICADGEDHFNNENAFVVAESGRVYHEYRDWSSWSEATEFAIEQAKRYREKGN